MFPFYQSFGSFSHGYDLFHIFSFILPFKMANSILKIGHIGTFLVAQWLRLCAPVQGAWVQSLVRELDLIQHDWEFTCHS